MYKEASRVAKKLSVSLRPGPIVKLLIKSVLLAVFALSLWLAYWGYQLKLVNEGKDTNRRPGKEFIEKAKGQMDIWLCRDPESKICKDHQEGLRRIKESLLD